MDQNAMGALGMTGAMQQAAMAQANPAVLRQQRLRTTPTPSADQLF